MRLVTFNILSGRSPHAPTADLDVFADAVRSLDADVLALQEVDRDQPRSGRADLTAVAAAAMGAVDHRFVPALVGTPGQAWRPAAADDPPRGAAYGVALLSRHPVTAWHVLRLPTLRRPAPMWFAGDRRPHLVEEEPRVAVAAEVAAPGGTLTVVSTHLSYLPWWNPWQLRRLVARALALPGPLVLLGDLNLGPRRARALTGMTALAAHPTFPAERPTRQLDHVLADGALRVLGTDAPELGVSDHRPLVVDLG